VKKFMSKKFDSMEKKIYDAGMVVKIDCAGYDLLSIVNDVPEELIPDAVKDFEYFINLLVNAGDRKMFYSRDRALKKLIGRIK